MSAPRPSLEDLAAQPALRPLDPEDVAAALTASAELTGWRLLPATAEAPPQLAVDYTTGDFATALALADRIGAAAEAADHHPELLVAYGRLGLTLHSHDVGALTSRDIRLTRTVARLAAQML